jgi:hypothetical protein
MLKEPVLSGATQVAAGGLYLVNNVVTPAPSTQSVSAWQAQIGGSPVIRACDVVGRSHGAYSTPNPQNTDKLGRSGGDIFEI